jgi:hypothetical protein
LYELTGYDPAKMTNIAWTSSSNVTVFSPNQPSTGAFFSTTSPKTGEINVDYKHIRHLPQYFIQSPLPFLNGDPIIQKDINGNIITVDDECLNHWEYPIRLGQAKIKIDVNIKPCAWTFDAYAIREDGSNIGAGTTLNWTITSGTNVLTGTGAYIDFMDAVQSGGNGPYDIQLQVMDDCNANYTLSNSVYIELCDEDPGGQHTRQVQVSPNPTQNQINISLMQITDTGTGQSSPLTIGSEGFAAYIRNINGGSNLLNTRIYTNGQNVNVSSLPNGYYNIFVEDGGVQPLSAIFVILR